MYHKEPLPKSTYGTKDLDAVKRSEAVDGGNNLVSVRVNRGRERTTDPEQTVGRGEGIDCDNDD